MIQKIIDAIIKQIRTTYGESYEIYTESVKQGLREPCFSILCLTSSLTHVVGTRYQKSIPFIIRYWSDVNDEKLVDALSVCEQLEYLLKDISVDEYSMHAEVLSGQVVDGVLQFEVTYEPFLLEEGTTEESPEAIDVNIGTKGW